ncbi:MAG: Uma2 family endonuclease [Verrucomicrobia bacterium]|nr:Uma2 family endonuclease [Cytophagales bacterium]
MPNFHHGILEMNLGFELKSAYHQEYIVATEVTLDTPPNGSTPDLVVYPAQPVDFTMEIPAKQTTPPFITIEIQSPSQSLDEMVDKANIYFAFGVKSCWIVQPRIKAILVFSRPDHYQFFHFDDVLKDPNFNITLNLTNIFS